MWPLIVLNSAEKYTLPLGMANLVGTSGQGEQLWGIVMAGAVIATLPLLIAYIFGQKQFIAGLAYSGAWWPVNPEHGDHRFRGMSTTQSEGCRPVF
jgi:ABC-type glycerol-3-phosphate transport system permease component